MDDQTFTEMANAISEPAATRAPVQLATKTVPCRSWHPDGSSIMIDVIVTEIGERTHFEADGVGLRVKRRFELTDATRLLLVRFEAPRDTLWCGIRGARDLDRIRKNDTKIILASATLGETFQMFHPNGDVSNVTFKQDAGDLDDDLMQPDAALNARLEFVKDSFAKSHALKDEDKKTRSRIRNFHELASLLAKFGINEDPKLAKQTRDRITTVVGSFYRQSGCSLNQGVIKHFQKSLQAIGDKTTYVWLKTEEKHERRAHKSARSGDRRLDGMFPGRNEYAGAHVRTSKQNERSQRDQALRASMKGSGGSAQKQSKKK